MSVTVRVFDPKTGDFNTPAVIVANKYKLNEVQPDYQQIVVMRPSVLGNKFKVGDKPGEFARGEAVKAHETWFREEMRKDDSPVKKEILKLAQRVANGEKIALVCCCKPKPCHADVMAIAILAYATKLKGDNSADSQKSA